MYAACCLFCSSLRFVHLFHFFSYSGSCCTWLSLDCSVPGASHCGCLLCPERGLQGQSPDSMAAVCRLSSWAHGLWAGLSSCVHWAQLLWPVGSSRTRGHTHVFCVLTNGFLPLSHQANQQHSLFQLFQSS